MKTRIKNLLMLPSKAWNYFLKATLKKKIIVVALFIIGAIIASNIINNITKPPPYTTARVERADIKEAVSETGSIVASGTNEVFSPTNGVVTEVYVANKDTVTEGQELFKVTSSATEQQANAAYSNYLTAQSTLNAAQSGANTLRATMYDEWDSFRNLATNGTYENGDDTPNEQNRTAAEFQIAKDQWLAAERKYKDQQTVIAQGQAQVSSTWLLYQATQNAIVKASANGVVSNLSIKAGSPVKATTQSITDVLSPVLIISSGTLVDEVLIELSETDIAKIKPGQKAEIDVNAVSNKKYTGKVTRADEIGTDSQGVITYKVYITIENADIALRSGMNVDAEIITKEIKDVLTVPNSAIKPYQGGKAVRVPDKKAKEGIKFLPVIVGVRGEEKTEIIKGLSADQEIITTLSNEQLKRPGLFGN